MTVRFLTACGRWSSPPHCSAASLDSTASGSMRESAARAVELERDPMSPWYALAQAALGFSLYLSGEPGAAEPLEEGRDERGVHPAGAHWPFPPRRWWRSSRAGSRKRRSLRTRPGGLGRRRISATRRRIPSPTRPPARFTRCAGAAEEARSEFEHALRSRGRWPGHQPVAHGRRPCSGSHRCCSTSGTASEAAALWTRRLLLTSLPDGAEAMRARLERLERRLRGQPRATSAGGPAHRTRGGGAASARGARSRSARSGRSCTCRRTRSRPMPRRSTGSSASPPGTTPSRRAARSAFSSRPSLRSARVAVRGGPPRRGEPPTACGRCS